MLDPIQHSKEIDATLDSVWKALTTPDLIEQWLMPNNFKPIVGKPFVFKWNPDAKDDKGKTTCKVTQMIPKRQLTYTWREKGFPTYTMVTFELVPKPGSTLVTLTHDRWERFEKEKWRHYWAGLNNGWRDRVLEDLASTAEAKSLAEA